MTPLPSLRKLLAEGTPGPWRAGTHETWHVFAPHNDGFGPERVLLRMNEHFPYTNDARLIVAAVNALPALLDVAERAAELIHGRGPWFDMQMLRAHSGPLESALRALEAEEEG